jgi:hypothetical protein
MRTGNRDISDDPGDERGELHGGRSDVDAPDQAEASQVIDNAEDLSRGASLSSARAEALATWTSVNPYAFALGCIGVIVLTRITSYLTPYKLYFSFASFLFSDDNEARWTALTFKLAIPVIVGLLLFYLPYHWLRITDLKRNNAHPVVRYLHSQAELTARFSCFFAALLLAWPFIAYWDLIAPPYLSEHRFGFFLIYFLYLVSYSYFGGVGISIGKWLVGEHLSEAQVRNVRGSTALVEAVRTSVLGVATSAIATFLASNLATSH